MALSGRDRARLGRIEAELTRADPRLAARFRRWQLPGDDRPAPAGWSTAPPWMLLVFLAAFCTWTVTPAVGWLVAVLGACGWVGERLGARQRQRHHAAGDTGWWYRPIDRW